MAAATFSGLVGAGIFNQVNAEDEPSPEAIETTLINFSSEGSRTALPFSFLIYGSGSIIDTSSKSASCVVTAATISMVRAVPGSVSSMRSKVFPPSSPMLRICSAS